MLKSQEVSTAFTLLVGFMVLSWTGGGMLDRLGGFSRTIFSHAADFELSTGSLPGYMMSTLKLICLLLMPLSCSIFVAAIVINILQVGFLFTTETLTVKFDAINPLEGAKRLLSMRSLMELFKAIMKITIVLTVAWFTLKGSVLELSAAAMSPLGATLHVSKDLFFRLSYRILGVFAVIAALDWMFQRWDYEKRMMMSHQDVKEENKQSEGNPMVKGRIRALQIAASRKRMMSAVQTADVIVTNPTHLAVALSYKAGEMAAPTVVAKGARLLAQKIKDIAREHGVPVIEDKPLARALYKTVEVGQPVPAALYRAVAEVLAYVFRLKGKRA